MTIKKWEDRPAIQGSRIRVVNTSDIDNILAELAELREALAQEKQDYTAKCAELEAVHEAHDRLALVPQSKPGCSECEKFAKSQAAEKEWHASIARGREIIKQMAAAKDKP